MWFTVPSASTVPQTSDCIFQLKWKITIDKELYIQNSPRKMWSQPETWQVPPRPGPSQGNRKPKLALSGIRRELRAYNTPLSKMRTVTWMVNAWMWWTMKSAVPNVMGIIAILSPIATIPPPKAWLTTWRALGAVLPGANVCRFCTHWANTGCNWIALSENISWGRPKARMVSLWMYKPKLWKPKKIQTQLRWEMIASRWRITRSKTLFWLTTGS